MQFIFYIPGIGQNASVHRVNVDIVGRYIVGLFSIMSTLKTLASSLKCITIYALFFFVPDCLVIGLFALVTTFYFAIGSVGTNFFQLEILITLVNSLLCLKFG